MTKTVLYPGEVIHSNIRLRIQGTLAASGLPPGEQFFDVAPSGFVPYRIEQTSEFNPIYYVPPGAPQPAGEQVYDLTVHWLIPRPIDETWLWRQVDKLGQDTLPFPNRDWPLPQQPYRIDQTWTWRQVDKLGKDTVPGKQVYDLSPIAAPRLPYYGTEWRQVGMLGQDVLPKNQTDWPLPGQPYRIDQTWVWRQLDKLGQDKLPVGKQVYDLTIPDAQRAINLRDWIQSVNLALVTTPPVIPHNQYDWPNPRAPLQSALSWEWRQVDKLGKDRLPNNQTDWPLPGRDPPQYRTWELGPLPSKTPPPQPMNRQNEWPLPQQPFRPDFTWIQFTTSAPLLMPGQSEWPLPDPLPRQAIGQFDPWIGLIPNPAPAPVTTSSVGSGISGGYFSRKRWHAIVGALSAEQAALEKAEALKFSLKRRAQLREIYERTSEARAAAESATESERIDTALERLTKSAQAAIEATKKVDRARHFAETAKHHAAVMEAIRKAQFEQDEEEAIMLLLN